MSYKTQYCKFCKEEKNMPIFFKDWWLDTLCGEKNWDVACVFNKSNEIAAALPYMKKSSSRIGMPPFTQSMGPYIVEPEDIKYTNQIGNQIKYMDELIEQLPKISYFNQRFHYTINNWLPFYWHNFKQTTRYTYILPDLSDIDAIHAGLRENVRRNLKKSAREEIKVNTSEDIHSLSAILSANHILKKGEDESLRQIHKSCSQHKCGKIFAATDKNNELHAMIFLVWDNYQAYYLIGGSVPKHKRSSAMTLLIWESIKFAAKVTKSFNFEGSMIRPVERFFRAFGAIQTPYFQVYKYNSILVRSYIGIKGIFDKKLF